MNMRTFHVSFDLEIDEDYGVDANDIKSDIIRTLSEIDMEVVDIKVFKKEEFKK